MSSSSISTPCVLIFIFLLALPLSYATFDKKIPVQSVKCEGMEKKASPEPEKNAPPSPEKTASPSPEKTSSPAPENKASPSPEKNSAPAPAKVKEVHDNLCKTAPDPDFCKKLLAKGNNSTDPIVLGRITVEESTTKSKQVLNVIDDYKKKSTKPAPALDDCQELAELNDDFSAFVFSKLKDKSTVLSRAESDELETRLSALMTNQQACLDSMDEVAPPPEVKAGINKEIETANKLFGMSLAIFQQGYAPPRKNEMKWIPPPNLTFPVGGGDMALKMSKQSHQMYENVTGRRHALEAEEGTVKISEVVAVKKDGTGNFTTIADAIAAAPTNTDGSKGYFMIYIAEGVYEEYLLIAKHKTYLMLIGDGIGKTVITGNHSNRGGWTTYKSATLAVVSPNFVAVNITIRNTAGPEGHQAVAVRNGADLSAFFMCSFEGYQDTLYAHSLRQFYRECDVYGTVDYIFGNAEVVFQNCNFYSRLAMPGQKNAVTAQGRVFETQNTGTSVLNCSFLAAPELAASPGSTKTYLGRPWKEYSRTLIMNSFIDSLIEPSGWEPWNETFALETLYYVEYNNTGPGASTANRVKWPGYHTVVEQAIAANYTVSNFIDGDEWLPQTGVPYQGGPLA